MGLERCETHGDQQGPMCCEHVGAAARGATGIQPGDCVEFEVDLGDDGEILLPYVICAPCAERFSLSSGKRYSGAFAEKRGTMPWVAPTCVMCVDSWRIAGIVR